MRFLLATAAMAVVLGSTAPAHAQDRAIEGRVDRLEREMRAVQRKVFPGGAGQTVEPQITPEASTSIPGIPAGTPISDLTQRVAAIEEQLQSLTGQVEQGQHRLRLLEEAFAAYKSATDARIKALEDGAASAPATTDSGDETVASNDVPAASIKAPAAAEKPAEKAEAEKPAAKLAGTRAERLAAVERPKSDDPAEDGYIYGYRLWNAKLYPEARKELEAVVAKYPKHRRASYAQNLLGRAYLDAGAPSLAAIALHKNYQTNPNGERAPDSLFYLAEALIKLKKPASEVCKVYDELTEVYGDKISATMAADVEKGRASQKCQ